MGKRFDIAIVGCGGVAQMHFEGYVRHPDRIHIVAACDPDPSHARASAQKWSIPAVFSSVDEMIEGASWEVAVVCTPTSVREAVVSTLAAAGKHLFVEKPMADSYEEAHRMVRTCQEAGVKLAVDQNFRYHYPFDQARTLIQAGRIGKAISITNHDLFFRQDRGWRIQQPRHALAVMGIHWLDGFRWALGCEARSLLCHTHRSPAIDCVGETEAAVQMTFENDVAVSYVQSFSSPLAVTRTLILGEEGLLSLDYQSMTFYQRSTGQTPAEQWTNPYAGANKPESVFVCLDHLLTAIETGGEPPNSGQDNLRSVALLDAAYQSAAGGGMIRFEGGLPV